MDARQRLPFSNSHRDLQQLEDGHRARADFCQQEQQSTPCGSWLSQKRGPEVNLPLALLLKMQTQT